MQLQQCAPVLKRPLEYVGLPEPTPGRSQVLLKVKACGVCRTDLHVVEGELTDGVLPIVPGHQIVGEVVGLGAGISDHSLGDRLGVAWLGQTCGECGFCKKGIENLCDNARFTGYQIDGGFAEYVVANADFCYPIPDGYPDLQAAPLLCAGLIGYRSLKLAEVEPIDGPGRIGLYGFGASAHIVIQVALSRGYEVNVFTRTGDKQSQQFALELGATWAGASGESPPQKLDAAIIFAPVGALIPAALKELRKGGVCVCAGIHMSPIPGFHYNYLWGERVIRSVANLTRADGREFLELAPQVPVYTEVEQFPLDMANEALIKLKAGEIRGAAVLVP